MSKLLNQINELFNRVESLEEKYKTVLDLQRECLDFTHKELTVLKNNLSDSITKKLLTKLSPYLIKEGNDK